VSQRAALGQDYLAYLVKRPPSTSQGHSIAATAVGKPRFTISTGVGPTCQIVGHKVLREARLTLTQWPREWYPYKLE